MEVKFSECSLISLEKLFGLEALDECPALQAWLTSEADISDWERTNLEYFRQLLRHNAHNWNEIELIEYLIAPLFALIDFNTDYFKMFAERRITAVVGAYELYGEPDTLIAKGTYTPKTPYFCFNEYKRIEDAKGDALGQVLAEMLAAHSLNPQNIPIYGVYVVDKVWYFLVLHDNAYCITEGHYAAHETDLADIFRILKALKVMLIEIAQQEA